MGQKENLLKKFIKRADESDIKKIDQNLGEMKKGKVTQIWSKVQALYQMIKDPEAAWKSKAMAIGALIYLISPLDAIPDVFPGAGLTDDVAIILGTVAVLGHELKKYMRSVAEEIAEVEVQKHNRKIRVTLISLIISACLAILVKFFFTLI